MSRRPRVHGLDDSCDEASQFREDFLVSHFRAFERQRMPSSLVFRSLHAMDIASHLDPEPRGSGPLPRSTRPSACKVHRWIVDGFRRSRWRAHGPCITASRRR